jgi:hypothetical protein
MTTITAIAHYEVYDLPGIYVVEVNDPKSELEVKQAIAALIWVETGMEDMMLGDNPEEEENEWMQETVGELELIAVFKGELQPIQFNPATATIAKAGK